MTYIRRITARISDYRKPVVPSLAEFTFDKEQLSHRSLGSGSFLQEPRFSSLSLGQDGDLIVRLLLLTAHDLGYP